MSDRSGIVRIGIIGCGRVTATLHLPALRDVREAAVTAVADIDPVRLQRTADTFGVPRRYRDYSALLKDPEVDVAAVCVPTPHHVESALAALDAGKHVFIEKPLALDVKEADRLVERAARSSRKVLVGFNLRWHRLIRQARAMLDRRAVGAPVAIRSIFSNEACHVSGTPDWAKQRGLGGGVFIDLAAHHIDLWRFLFRCEVEEIFAMAHSDGHWDDATGAITARLSNGAMASAFFSQRTAVQHDIEVYGESGRLQVSCYRFDGLELDPRSDISGSVRTRLRAVKRTLTDLPHGIREWRRGGEHLASYRGEWRHFIQAILKDGPVECTVEDGRRSLRVLLAALESASSGKPIKVEPISPSRDTAPQVSVNSSPEQGLDMNPPALSVVIVTPDRYATIRRTIKHLRAQTVHDQLEVVIVAPSAEGLALDEEELKAFRRVRVVEVGTIASIGSANAAGVRHAAAPVVALAEDHAFPAPGWAEALIAAHRGPWAAVGPVIRNANPGSVVSWADLLIAYAPWLAPGMPGPIDHLPGHNSSYKREILLKYGSRLEAMMEAESVLHWDLSANGHRLYLEPGAKLSHMNFERLSSWLPAQFYSGRVFAAARSKAWSLLRRMIFTAGAPAIPALRFLRIRRQFGSAERRPGPPFSVWPVLLVGLAASAAGEMAGYCLGAGDVKEKLAGFEFHRVRHLVKGNMQPEGEP